MSLTEIMATLAVAALLAADAASFGHSALRHIARQQALRDLRQALLVTSEMFEREWRIAGFSPTGTIFSGVPIAGASEITFEADLNGDGDRSDAHERVAYSWDADRRTVFRATLWASPQPWLSDLTDGGFELQYFDSSGQPLWDLRARRQASAIVLRLCAERQGGPGSGFAREWVRVTSARRNPAPP